MGPSALGVAGSVQLEKQRPTHPEVVDRGGGTSRASVTNCQGPADSTGLSKRQPREGLRCAHTCVCVSRYVHAYVCVGGGSCPGQPGVGWHLDGDCARQIVGNLNVKKQKEFHILRTPRGCHSLGRRLRDVSQPRGDRCPFLPPILTQVAQVKDVPVLWGSFPTLCGP